MLSVPKQLRWLLALSAICMIMPAYGYLDGNSGSIIVQVLLGGLAGFLAVIKLYWHKLKTFVLHLFGKAPKETYETETDEQSSHSSESKDTNHHDKS